MGKAIPNMIKSKCNDLLEALPNAFSNDFEKNKQVIHALELPWSKKQKNLMAGYMTRLVKKKAKEISVN